MALTIPVCKLLFGCTNSSSCCLQQVSALFKDNNPTNSTSILKICFMFPDSFPSAQTKACRSPVRACRPLCDARQPQGGRAALDQQFADSPRLTVCKWTAPKTCLISWPNSQSQHHKSTIPFLRMLKTSDKEFLGITYKGKMLELHSWESLEIQFLWYFTEACEHRHRSAIS